MQLIAGLFVVLIIVDILTAQLRAPMLEGRWTQWSGKRKVPASHIYYESRGSRRPTSLASLRTQNNSTIHNLITSNSAVLILLTNPSDSTTTKTSIIKQPATYSAVQNPTNPITSMSTISIQTNTKSTTPKSTTPNRPITKSSTPKSTTPSQPTTKSTTPKSTTPNQPTTKSTTPKSTTPNQPTTKSTTPKSTTPNQPTTKSTTPKSTTPNQPTTKSTTPKSTTPNQPTTKSTTPKSTTPNQPITKSTTSKSTTPNQPTTKSTTPKSTTPKQPTTKSTTQKSTTPNQPTTKSTTPKSTTPNQPTIKSTTPKSTTSKQPTTKSTTPKSTTPKPATTKSTTPRSTTLRPSTLKSTSLKPSTMLTSKSSMGSKPTKTTTSTPKQTPSPPADPIYTPSLDNHVYRLHSSILWDLAYSSILDDKDSQLFKDYQKEAQQGLQNVFSPSAGKVEVDSFFRGSTVAQFDVQYSLKKAVYEAARIDSEVIQVWDSLESIELGGHTPNRDLLALSVKPGLIKEFRRMRSDKTTLDVCNETLYQDVCPKTHRCVVTLTDAHPVSCRHKCHDHSCSYLGPQHYVECYLDYSYRPTCRCTGNALPVGGECVDKWQVIGPVLGVGLLVLAVVIAIMFIRWRNRDTRPNIQGGATEFNNPVAMDASSTY